MSHPLEGAFDGERAERDRLWQRRDEMEERLKKLSLSEFTFAQFADLQLIADRSAPSARPRDLKLALEHLEKFLDNEGRPRKSPRRGSR